MSDLVISQLKPGMIGLSGGGAFIQRAIKFFTRSEFSHSFAILPGPYSILSAFETTSTITSTSPLESKLEEPDYVQIWELLQATEEEIHRALELTYRRYSHRWYGYLSYLWFMYRAVARLFGHEPKRMWSWASNGITCTELTCYFLAELNSKYADLFWGCDLNTISPEELKHIMLDNPLLFRFFGWLKPKP